MYGYQCKYCEGTVQPRLIKREVFKHRDGFVILEDVTTEKTEKIPVTHLELA